MEDTKKSNTTDGGSLKNGLAFRETVPTYEQPYRHLHINREVSQDDDMPPMRKYVTS